MDRNRDARRASIVGSNGFNRRRHRTNFPEEDGGPELRERVKKDRDRDLRERGRERDFARERSSRSKRRRADRFTAGDDTSDESVNDEEEEEENGQDGHVLAVDAAARLSSPPAGSISNHNQHLHGGGGGHSSSFSQQQHISSSNIVSSNNNNNHHLQHRKTFPPSSSSSTAKVLRPPPVWKPGDEMISVSVPRKARSASTKRSHDWISSSNNSGGGDPSPAQPSSSPATQTPAPPPSAAAPTSPSSSNAAVRKKLKHGLNINPGPKLKPPKASSSSAKPSSSNPEELEIEIAEVLYGLMTQSQGPPPSSRDISRLNGDGKSLNSSPVANSVPNNHNSNSPLSAVAPKRKRPRQVPEGSGPGFGVRSSPLSAKLEAQLTDQTAKSEMSSPPNPEVTSRSAVENVSEMRDILVISQAVPAGPVKLDSESKDTGEELRESRDLINRVKEDVSSSKELESSAVRDQDRNNSDPSSIAIASAAPITINANMMLSEDGNQKKEKFEIDLMAPPRQIRSSPERETKTDMRASAVVDQKPALSTLDADLKLPRVLVSKDNEDENEKSKIASGNNNHLTNVAAAEGKKPKEDEVNRTVENKGRNLDFRLDSEKPERDVCSSFSANENKSQLPTQKHQQPLKLSKEEQPLTEKPGHLTSSLPLTMPVASWPGGLPQMGYMAPLQGVVTPAHIQPLFSQPRPKRCATHCHIARNIHCLQQFMKMNPFWPAPGGSPAGAASLFGSKPCGNLTAVPPASDLNVTVRGVTNNSQDNKGPALAWIPNNGGKEIGFQQENSSDSAQRKPQIMIQQAMPSAAPTNLLGPTFIIPINQQQAAARPGPASTKSPSTTAAPSNVVASASATPSSTSLPGPMSFNYPNMSPNETHYLAILQNNAYPFTIPTVGPPPNYRSAPPAQAMPLFNGSFYSSQIMHQQLQHSQQQPSNQPPLMMQVHHNTNAGQMMQAHHNTNAGQMMQAHHNVSAGNNSLSSQKQQHIQSQQQQQQQRSQNSFSSQKAQPPPHSNHYMQSGGNDDNSSSSMADNRGSRATSGNIYGQNFALPIHPQNFALMSHPNGMAGANISNQAEKKSSSQPQQQHQGMKTGVLESLPPHTFAMSFGPGMDGASMAQSHAMFQNCSDGSRQNIQMMAAAASAAAQATQKNNFRISEAAKSGNSGNHDNSFAKEDERKSFAFSDTRAASQANNNVVLTRNSRPATSNGQGTMNAVQNAHVQAQLQMQQQQQQQQILKLKHQQQQQLQMATNTANRTNKPPVTNNGNIYSEHLNSSPAMGGNIPNTVSPVFPQNLVQSSSSSQSQSPQWKSSTRSPTASSQAGPSSLGSSTQMMHKNLPQQHSRSQPPMHAQISFGGNQKQPATPSQGQGPPPSSHQGPSSPMMVGSPTTSLSKGTSGSPRTNSSASTTNNKTVGHHASPFSAQPPKNSPSILGNPKAQMQQQQPQQKNMQQGHLFFSNPYSQPPHLTSAGHVGAGPGGYSVPQRRPDQHQRVPSGTSTNDPATAIAAATNNAKGASPFGAQSAGTLLPAGFSYVHPMPAGVQVKPTEQKQPAGNDNLHKWQPEKK